MIKTYVYIGKNLYSERQSSIEDEFYFQDPKSYIDHGELSHLSPDIEHEKFVANIDTLFQMYDLQGLIERLSKTPGGVNT